MPSTLSRRRPWHRHLELGSMLLISALMACNTLTGADDVNLVDGKSTQSDGGGGGTTGLGGGENGGTGGDVTLCDWPTEVSFGVDVMMTAPPFLSWQGIAEGGDQEVTISIEDYYDCDGSRGINAVLFTTTQYGCGACIQEAQTLQGLMDSSWKSMGIKVLTLLLDGPDEGAPTVEDARNWSQTYGFEDIAVAADPNFSMVPGSTVGTPQGTIIDPRAMLILDVQQGYSGDYSKLTNLAQQNAVK